VTEVVSAFDDVAVVTGFQDGERLVRRIDLIGFSTKE
jgi:hypothetical protein